MSTLTFKMKYADAKWPAYLEETFGKEVAEKCVVESTQTATVHDARIQILNFKGDKKVVDILTKNENVLSAYLVDNNEIVQTIK